MPYSMLLHAGARETLNLNLHNAVIIIDEAHNIIDAITDVHTVTVTLHQVRACRCCGGGGGGVWRNQP